MEKDLMRCPVCHKLVKNAFTDPYDTAANISPFHSKRTETEYCFKCPECSAVYLYPSKPQ